MQRHGVTHTFLFPTALKAMMKAVPTPRERYRAAAARHHERRRGGRRRGVRLLPRRARRHRQRDVRPDRDQLHRRQLRAPTSTPTAAPSGWPARPGSMGRPYPGHRIAVIDDDGHEVPARHAGRRGGAPARRARPPRPGVLPRLLEATTPRTRAKFTGDPDD